MGVLLMMKFKVFSRLNGFFSRLNPLNSFEWGDVKVDVVKPPAFKELLEKTIHKYPQFEKIILIGIYHLINTQNADKEYLTVLTKDLRLICDLVEGDDSSVEIPEILDVEPIENILLTCHNHFNRCLIPSSKDFKNIVKPKIKFTILVSQNCIVILINELQDIFFEFDDDELKEFKNTWKLYNDYIIFSLGIEHPDVILKFLDDDSGMTDEEFQEIFEIFVGEHLLKFIIEFNIRFKKYNMYCIHIRI